MKKKLDYLRRQSGWILILIGISAYVLISGTTGSCPTCSAITQFAGIVPTKADISPEEYKQLGVGDKIPSGSLYASSGDEIDVNELISSKPTVVIIYRGGWCPFCNKHLSAIVDIIPELNEMGVQLVAISPDRPEILKRKPALSDLPYTLLSDSKMEWISKMGIVFKVPDSLVDKYKSSYNIDIEADSGQTHHLLPHPSVFVLDQSGVIQFSYVNENYKVRLEPEKILEAARKVAK